MELQVIGAGVGRTGTSSLKVALERLLGGPCYHMYEVLRHPDHVPLWRGAIHGRYPDWGALYAGFAATVDWPGAAFWRPLSEAAPNALVLLSVRSSASEWYQSASNTIEKLLVARPPRESKGWHSMARELLGATFTPLPFERAAAEAAYERHNAEVRASIPADRLLEWNVSDGWEPICERLGVSVPDEPFPHLNTEQGFTAMLERRSADQRILPRLRRRLRR